MYILETEGSFEAAHFLKDYQGKCSNIHGHRWRIRARISSGHLEESGQIRGMVMDFGQFKNILGKLTGEFDHTMIIEKGSLRETTVRALLEEGFSIREVPFRPTAEEFARYFYQRLASLSCPVREVAVYETPKNCAIYREDAI